ncbi:MAG: PDZ domain-containing protein [Candidatus Zophobacter franzmannii]|nr:PDZ domain-containing protein [Candidatus Zophobacter franzmannii]
MLMILKRLIVIFILVAGISVLSADAWLGISIIVPSEEKLAELGQSDLYGIQVINVEENSPAEIAGIIEDDLITKIDGDKIYTTGQFIKMISSMEIGKEIKLLVIRNKKGKTVKFSLEEKQVNMKAFLGVVVIEPHEDTFEKMGVNYGLTIAEVIDGSSAEEAELERDYVLLKINDDKLYTAGQLSKILATLKPKDELSITYFDGKDIKSKTLIIGGKPVNKFGNNDFSFNFFGFPDKLTVLRYGDGFDKLGMKLEDTKSGVKVIEVFDDSIAEENDIEVDDKVLELNGKKVAEIDTFYELLSKVKGNETIELVIKRGKKKKTLKLKLEDVQINRSFDLDIDDNGVKIIIDGQEKIILDQDSFPRLQEYFDDFDVEEMIERFKNNMPDGKEIDIKFLKKKINSERI